MVSASFQVWSVTCPDQTVLFKNLYGCCTLVTEVLHFGMIINTYMFITDLFAKLENPATAQSLGVKNFGISMTTLEEVFLKLG